MKGKNIFLLILVLFLVGCTKDIEKVKINDSEFINTLTNNNFTVNDSSESYVGDKYISSNIATYNDIEIEFINYDNEEDAESVLMGHIKSFNNLKSTAASEKNEKGNNYHKYILISNNYYMISVRVDNSLMFCKTPLNNKDIVENIFNSLGY